MRKVWKWVAIGFGALVVLALIALPFVLRAFGGPLRVAGFGRAPMMGGGFFGRGAFFGGGLMAFAMFLVSMALIGLAVIGLIAVIKAAARPPQAAPLPPQPPAPGAPAASPVAPVDSSLQPPAPPQPMHNCLSCGRLLQAEWMACPYCGKAVSG